MLVYTFNGALLQIPSIIRHCQAISNVKLVSKPDLQMIAEILKMLLLVCNLLLQSKQPTLYKLVILQTISDLLFTLSSLDCIIFASLLAFAECITRLVSVAYHSKISGSSHPEAVPPERRPPVSPSAILEVNTVKLRVCVYNEDLRAGRVAEMIA